MEWIEVNEESFESNLCGVLLLSVTYYENHGWRGYIKGYESFQPEYSYGKKEDAIYFLENRARLLLVSALQKLNGEN